MANTIAFDVKKITKILAFDTDAQREEYYKQDFFGEYSLYLVGGGSQVANEGTVASNSEVSSFTDLYYGDKKVTDLIVTSEFPGNEEYPDDKFYIVPIVSEAGDIIYSYKVYFKHKGVVSEIVNSFIKSVQYNKDSKMTTIVWNNNTVTGAPDNFVTELITSDSIYGILQNLKDGYNPSIPIDDRRTQKETLDILSTSVVGLAKIYSEDSTTGDYIIDNNETPTHTVDEYIKKEIGDRTRAVQAEAEVREATDSALRQDLNQEIRDRITAVSTEASARTEADNELRQDLNQEIRDREIAISNEEQAREDADADIMNILSWHPVID